VACSRPTAFNGSELLLNPRMTVTYTRPPAHVVAGALFDAEGRVLIAQRPEGKHLEGGWEFPGGKLEAGETRFEALARELLEEIGVHVHGGEPLICYDQPFGDRLLTLDLWLVTKYTGTPYPREGQPLKWVRLDELDTVGLLDADLPMIPALRATQPGRWAAGSVPRIRQASGVRFHAHQQAFDLKPEASSIHSPSSRLKNSSTIS
jgi:8-oxo-dGTP diphosphatase